MVELSWTVSGKAFFFVIKLSIWFLEHCNTNQASRFSVLKSRVTCGHICSWSGGTANAPRSECEWWLIQYLCRVSVVFGMMDSPLPSQPGACHGAPTGLQALPLADYRQAYSHGLQSQLSAHGSLQGLVLTSLSAKPCSKPTKHVENNHPSVW